MFAETDRVWIRHFLGYSALFLQADPRLENAITSIQSVAEQGQRPDSSSENYAKSLLYGSAEQCGMPVTLGPLPQKIVYSIPATLGLIAIEQQCSGMWSFAFASGKQDEATVDTFRGVVQLRSEGRRLASSLARMLGLNSVRADMFSPGQPIIEDDPFAAGTKQNWL